MRASGSMTETEDSLTPWPLRERVIVWERCASCGQEFRYPYLCRTHMLCGACHPPLEESHALQPG